jgi:hypothetical protein
MKDWTGRRLTLIGLFVGVGVAVGGIAYAAIPDSSGLIHGCYQKNGNLRVIDSTGKGCTTSEKPLSWSQTGLTGTTGAAGTTGPTGATGATGATGIVSNSEVVVEVQVPPSGNGGGVGTTVSCPSGDLVTGGGWKAGGGVNAYLIVTESHSDGQGWHVLFLNPSDGVTFLVDVYAECLDVTP